MGSRGAAADHALPLLFMGNFIKPGPSSKDSECLPRVVGKEEECVPSLLDVCSGKMDHVNMRQVVSKPCYMVWGVDGTWCGVDGTCQ